MKKNAIYLLLTFFCVFETLAQGNVLFGFDFGSHPAISFQHVQFDNTGGFVVTTQTNGGLAWGMTLGAPVADWLAFTGRLTLANNKIENDLYYENAKMLYLELGARVLIAKQGSSFKPYGYLAYGFRNLQVDLNGNGTPVLGGVVTLGGGEQLAEGFAPSVGLGVLYRKLDLGYTLSRAGYKYDEEDSSYPPLFGEQVISQRITIGITFF